ncbi:protein PHLOEM PROTEIN 2-LIKE A1-like [Chenopodium quinoa]|uniref:protein PHLOEM PROTEIN 2-LIKE A1-like n=1 Tax=Chenopodium quinoa TaxID=63459 RepID=UPI000B76F3A8|nr:protein PHLOEM PROTEIN 2-LIKE A1-like [Chenopodium quinoa]
MGNVMTELERNSRQQSSRPVFRVAEPSKHNHTPVRYKSRPSESTWDAIIKDNNSIKSAPDQQQKINEILSKGVYWDSRKKKYWVDSNGNNCFMVFANGLKITWSDNPNYWYLQKKSELGDDNITIAQLRNVAWLEVYGTFNTADLTRGVKYEVCFIVKLERTSYGWEVPVNFQLTLPDDMVLI